MLILIYPDELPRPLENLKSFNHSSSYAETFCLNSFALLMNRKKVSDAFLMMIISSIIQIKSGILFWWQLRLTQIKGLLQN